MKRTSVISTKSYALLFTGVFILFLIVGIVVDIQALGRQPGLRFAVFAVIISTFTVLMTMAGFALRKKSWKAIVPAYIALLVILNVIGYFWPVPPQPKSLDASQIAHLVARLNFDSFGILISLSIGFACVLYFTVTQVRKYLRARVEIELATEIHHVLVPQIETQMGGYEFYGRSSASGDVGGDLIDVAGADDSWVAYLADVSGHGVAPGVVMGMVKSAARTLLGSGSDTKCFLGRLNEVIYPLKKPDMFVTFCFVARNGDGLRVGLAGHPPILHFSARKRCVVQVESPNMPLGIMPVEEFEISELEADPGDVLALYTDGFLETPNASGEEFGLARFEQEFQKHSAEPLEKICRALEEAVAHHGAQFDDQSLLLLRKV